MRPGQILYTSLVSLLASTAFAQNAPPTTQGDTGAAPMTAEEIAGAAKDNARHFGDSPDDPGPIATDITSQMTSAEVLKVEKKVADWELERAEPYFGNNWTWGALYVGIVAATDATGDGKYRQAMEKVGEKYQWKLAAAHPTADDSAIGQMYLDLYAQDKQDVQIANMRAGLDWLIAHPGNPQLYGNGRAPATRPAANRPRAEVWWWCDALFMAPGGFVRMAQATGDNKYVQFVDDNWWVTSKLLYDPAEHLYFRDASYLKKTEANGKKLFWSRGNGWVIGGLARTIPLIPKDDPLRAQYITQFTEIAQRIVSLQSDDGLWRSGLLDPNAYGEPENSGSSFFTYALAWGINQGYLDKATYEPAVAKAWNGLVHHIHQDGRLDCIQMTGAQPAHFKIGSSYNYGIGGFLLAGDEVNRLVK